MIVFLSFRISVINSFIVANNQRFGKSLPKITSEPSFYRNIQRNPFDAKRDKYLKSRIIIRDASRNQEDIDDKVDEAPSYADEVNGFCNDMVRAILAGDEYKLKQVQYKVEDNHARLCGYDEETGKLGSPQMWLFLSSILKLMEHDLHEDADNLEGDYLESYMKILGLIEDSGWQLTEPVEQVSG